MGQTIARVTEAIRWPFTVAPMYFSELLSEKWEAILPHLSLRAAIAGARSTAQEIVDAGEVQVVLRETRIGYNRLDLIKRGYTSDRTWCIDVENEVHYEGCWTKVPNFSQVRRVSFRLRPVPHPKGNPTKVGSHLEMFIH